MVAARALLWLALLPAAARAAPAQDGDPTAARRVLQGLAVEGPLDNDTFVMTAATAAKALAEGDAFLAGRASPSGSELDQAFEAWRRALAESEPGALVPADVLALAPGPGAPPDLDPGGDAFGGGAGKMWRAVVGAHVEPARGAVGVWIAVQQRLRRLGPDAARRWRERFAELGAVELAAAGRDPDALADVERRNPLTPAAVRAALRCAELALEEGRLLVAREWLGRAGRHVAAADLGATFPAESLAARRRVIETVALQPAPARGPAPEGAPPAVPRPTVDWRRVAGLQLVNLFLIDDPAVVGRADLPAADRGVRPGAVDLGDGRAALQTASQLHLIDLETGAIEGVFEPAKLATDVAPEDVVAPEDGPGWPLLPAFDGEALVLIQGTATPQRGNAVVVVAPPSPGDVLPRLRWAAREGSVLGPGGARRLDPRLDALGNYEFQPGLVIAGETVVVQVWQRLRSESGFLADPRFASGGEVRAWVVGLDLRTGAARWATWLAKGVERGRGGLLESSARISNGQPLGLADGRVVVPTQLGVVACVDPVDGRVDWALRTRRRPADERAWAAAPPRFDGEFAHVAPADSDRLYWLRPGPDLDGHGVLAHPPAAVERPRCLADVIGRRSVAVLRAGIHPALALVDPVTGAVQEALHLAPEETLAGQPARAGGALVVSTDRGVYVFDRERELYLCASAGLLPDTVATGPRRPRAGEAGLGGTVHVFGDRILVAGPHLPPGEGRPSSIAWVFGPDPR